MVGQGQGEILRRARDGMRMTQAHLAQAACVSLSTVKRAERGASISVENLRSLCSVLVLDLGSLPQPAAEDTGTALLEGEFVDLEAAGRRILGMSGPILSAGRCQGALWLHQAGREEARVERTRRLRTMEPLAAISAVSIVLTLLALAFHYGAWVAILGHDASSPLTVAALLAILVGGLGMAFAVRPLLASILVEERLVREMGRAVGCVGAATRDAYVGFNEGADGTALTVIAWEDAGVRVTTEGNTATLLVEGNGRLHVVEGLPADSGLVTDALRLARRGYTAEAVRRPPEPKRRANPWRSSDVRYVTRMAPGYAWRRDRDTGNVTGPSGDWMVSLMLREGRVGIRSREALSLLTMGAYPRTHAVPADVVTWIRLSPGQAYSLVQGKPCDPERLARGWADADPGFVLSARHVLDERASPLELVLRRSSKLGSCAVVVMGLMFLLIPSLVRLDTIVSEPRMRELQASGLDWKAAHRAASPSMRFFQPPAAGEAGR